MGDGARPGLLGRHPGHAPEAVAQQRIGALLDAARDPRVRGATAGRVVLEAAVCGRIVGRRHDDAVGQRVGVLAVPGQDGVREGRRGRVPVRAVHAHVHAVGDQHLQGRLERRLREGVGVAGHEERAIEALRPAIGADGRRGGHDVRLVERRPQRGAAVARGPEGHPLARLVHVGLPVVVGTQQGRQVHQVRRVGRPPCPLARHPGTLLVPGLDAIRCVAPSEYAPPPWRLPRSDPVALPGRSRIGTLR